MTSSRTSQDNSSASSSMWPVDYIFNSVYSPLRLEQEVPNHQWRDAFEDLLALDSNGEMISLESRKKETETAVKILHGKASHFIYRMNRNLRQLARMQTELRERREKALLDGDMTRVSRIGNVALPSIRSKMDREIRNSKVVKEAVETTKNFPASQLKQRGQWIASLISSGALPGWTSHLEGGPTPGQQRMLIRERTDPSDGSDEQNGIVCTENALEKIFGRAKISERADSRVEIDSFGLRSDKVIAKITTSEEDGWIVYYSATSSPRHHLTAQSTTIERVLLPDGSKANKVVLTNHSVSGKEEKIEIRQDACKVLEEVEKARMLMQDEGNHWWSEYRRA